MILVDNGLDNEINVVESNYSDHVKITINGNNNIIKIDETVKFPFLNIFVVGDNNLIKICHSCNLRGNIHVRHGSDITIGENTTSVEMHIFSLEGKSIKIGSDCMFSSRVYIRNSDEHGIFDFDGNRINLAKDIIIGKHVWLGDNVTINKGVEILDNIVVGSGSIVIKSLKNPFAVYAGIPAKLIKENIVWKRDLS